MKQINKQEIDTNSLLNINVFLTISNQNDNLILK